MRLTPSSHLGLRCEGLTAGNEENENTALTSARQNAFSALHAVGQMLHNPASILPDQKMHMHGWHTCAFNLRQLFCSLKQLSQSGTMKVQETSQDCTAHTKILLYNDQEQEDLQPMALTENGVAFHLMCWAALRSPRFHSHSTPRTPLHCHHRSSCTDKYRSCGAEQNAGSGIAWPCRLPLAHTAAHRHTATWHPAGPPSGLNIGKDVQRAVQQMYIFHRRLQVLGMR